MILARIIPESIPANFQTNRSFVGICENFWFRVINSIFAYLQLDSVHFWMTYEAIVKWSDCIVSLVCTP